MRTPTLRSPRTWLLAVVSLAIAPSIARADDKLPGEAAELTDKVRAETEKHLATMQKDVEKDALAARRALLKLGPVVWPIVENASRLTPPEASKPHFALLKALLVKKAEPEMEALRARLRRRFLMDDHKGIHQDLMTFRQGLPDPSKPGKRLPLSVKGVATGATTVYRSADGSIVVGFGRDADDKNPDAPEVSVSSDTAGFVAAVGGRAMPYDRQSGRGADATATAAVGFAFGWGSDGATGKAPGGTGGEGGAGSALGGAGMFKRTGDGGAGAPG